MKMVVKISLFRYCCHIIVIFNPSLSAYKRQLDVSTFHDYRDLNSILWAHSVEQFAVSSAWQLLSGWAATEGSLFRLWWILPAGFPLLVKSPEIHPLIFQALKIPELRLNVRTKKSCRSTEILHECGPKKQADDEVIFVMLFVWSWLIDWVRLNVPPNTL